MPDAFLGLNILHDTSAAIVVDGELVAAVEEERFNRDRHTTAFPGQAIEYCIEQAGIRRKDICEIAVTFDYDQFKLSSAPFTRHLLAHDEESAEGRQRIAAANHDTWREAKEQLAEHGFADARYLRHHLTHAACGYYLSGYSEASVLVLDGRGEHESTSLWRASGTQLDALESYGVADSLGHLYSYVTDLCGLYKSFGNEGKTMGLAGYGTGRYTFEDVLTFSSQRYHLHHDELRKFDRCKVPLGEPDGNSRELAHAAQRRLEDVYQFLAARLESLTGCRSFVLSGGVALNCNANGELVTCPYVERLFVPPAAHDAGTSIGAAFLRWVEFSGKQPEIPSSLVYLGPDVESAQIDDAISASGLGKVARVTDPPALAARAIASGLIVGWFQGRSEFGPRALGNRSILADPRDPGMSAKLNERVKFREPWRPFAPSVISAESSAWFAPAVESPYMLLSFTVLPERRELIPAVTHVDGTSRIQTVRPEDNYPYYNLIRVFFEITGVPMVLNTSLNIRGEPIAQTAMDAIRCFTHSGLDVLVIGNMVAWKDSDPRELI